MLNFYSWFAHLVAKVAVPRHYFFNNTCTGIMAPSVAVITLNPLGLTAFWILAHAPPASVSTVFVTQLLVYVSPISGYFILLNV